MHTPNLYAHTRFRVKNKRSVESSTNRYIVSICWDNSYVYYNFTENDIGLLLSFNDL